MKIIFIYGTRPEAIKMAPLILETKKHHPFIQSAVCLTGQHQDMLEQVNKFFGIHADWDLKLMEPNQSLSTLTSRCISGISNILEKERPDLIFVQGDTTTVLAGALSAFYNQIKIAHLEAGLRSGNKYTPYPEELNRRIVSHLADFHFTATIQGRENLAREGITDNVHLVGNTVIDALHLGLDIIKNENESFYLKKFNFINPDKRIILITGHRRESFGSGFESICAAIAKISNRYPNAEIVYPVHLNPNVQEPVYRHLANKSNVYLLDPLDYPEIIWLMSKSYLILTDSGGIQEEAPSLGKPVLVMRDVTERQEGLIAGVSRLVGTSSQSIVNNVSDLMDNSLNYKQMSKATNPYGDGRASLRILDILQTIGNNR